MQAVIVAGGRAARFNGINKSMLPINGIPIIEHLVRLCKNAGIIDVGIVVGETTYVNIIRHLGNGNQLGVDITYFYPKSFAIFFQFLDDYTYKFFNITN